jgi:hypothetical protein
MSSVLVFSIMLLALSVINIQEPDNSGANQRQNSGATADQQKETPADRELARKIRKSITDDFSLSTTGITLRSLFATAWWSSKVP